MSGAGEQSPETAGVRHVVKAVCACGHLASMHGVIVGDTSCRRDKCKCWALNRTTRRCGCGTSWDFAGPDVCPKPGGVG